MHLRKSSDMTAYTSAMAESSSQPDLDAVVEQAWDRLYAKLQAISPRSPAELAERQSLAIIRSLAAECLVAGQALQKVAEALKMQPNATVTQRLQMANWTIKAASRAQQAAKSILG